MKPILLLSSLKEKLGSAVLFNAIGVGLLWLYTAIFPSIQADSASYNKVIKSISPTILKVFGASSISGDNLPNFLATKQFGFVWPLIIIFLCATLAISMIVVEIEQTTIGLWLAAPISRLSIYWSKFTAGVIWLVVSVILTVGGIIPIAAAYHLSVSHRDVGWLAVTGGLFALSIFSLSMLVASISSKRTRAYVPIGVILLAMFTFNVVAALNIHLVNLQYFSYFYYFNPSSLLNNGVVDSAAYYVFGGSILITSVLGAYIFKKRDFII